MKTKILKHRVPQRILIGMYIFPGLCFTCETKEN